MKYVYPAIFYKSDDVKDFWEIVFPDIDVVGTCGYSLYEALEDAEDTLGYILSCHEARIAGRLTEPFNNRVDPPTPLEKVVVKPNGYSSTAFVAPIKVDTEEYRKKLTEESVGIVA